MILNIHRGSLLSLLHFKLLHTNDLLPSRIDFRDDVCSCRSSATFQMNDTGYQHNIVSTKLG